MKKNGIFEEDKGNKGKILTATELLLNDELPNGEGNHKKLKKL